MTLSVMRAELALAKSDTVASRQTEEANMRRQCMQASVRYEQALRAAGYRCARSPRIETIQKRIETIHTEVAKASAFHDL